MSSLKLLFESIQRFVVEQSWPQRAVVTLGLMIAVLGILLGGLVRLTLLPLGFAAMAAPIIIVFRLPRTRKGQLGLVLALHCETAEERSRLQSDFVFRFRELARSGNVGKTIQVIQLSGYWSNRALDADAAESILNRTKAKYLLACRARKREVHGASTWFLDLRGMVFHGKIPKRDKRVLEQEFKELLAGSAILEAETDVLCFEMEAFKTEVVSRYILAIATYLSGDLERAEQLYADTARQMSENTGWEAGKAIMKRLPMRHAEILLSRTQLAYRRWLVTHSKNDAAIMKDHLDKVPREAWRREDYIFIRSIQVFLTDRNIDESLRLLATSRAKNSPPWRFSQAFLRAYQGDLQAASKCYKKIAQAPGEPNPRTILEVEEFLFWLQSEQNASFKASFCLGCLNRWIKRDYQSGLAEFQRFLCECPADAYKKQKQWVASWMSDMEARLEITSGG